MRIKFRKSWGDLNPTTKVIQSKKRYSRKKDNWKRNLDY